jgi:hypothetical protein
LDCDLLFRKLGLPGSAQSHERDLVLPLLRHSTIYGKSPEPVMSSISDARAEAEPRPGMDAVRAGSMNGPEAQILSLWLPQGVRSSLPRFRLG